MNPNEELLADNVRLRETLAYTRAFMAHYLSTDGDLIKRIDATLANAPAIPAKPTPKPDFENDDE